MPSATEQHQSASLELFERLLQARGLPSCHVALRALLTRSLPRDASPDVTLKYDFYLGRQQGQAWGVTVNDAHEGPLHAREVLRFSRSLGQGYRLEALRALAERVRGAEVSLTFAIGFDAPSAPPRLKFYFQERSWNGGVLRWAAVTPLLAELTPGVQLPELAAPTRAVGVVALDLTPDGGVSVKIYLGHESLSALCAGAPSEVGALAADMARVCPMPGQFYYLTVRPRRDAPPTYSINKIYDVTALLNGANGRRAEEAWADASGLFDLTGEPGVFQRFQALTAGMLAIPSATALEDGSKTADLYVAAIRPRQAP